MSTPDVTTHGQSIRADRMEYITTDDRIPDRITRLERAFAASGPVPTLLDPWHNVGTAGEPAFNAGSSNYGAPFNTGGFRKDPFGRVHLKGLVNCSAVGGTIFTLPVGYRPSSQMLLDAVANSVQGRVDVTPGGAVLMALGAANGWITLDGLYFDTDSVTTYLTGPTGSAGPQGPKGDTGPASTVPGPVGPGGTIEAYQQPSMPATVNTGAIWIDTDEVPPVLPGLQSNSLTPARVATTGNISLSAPGATIDGVTMVAGDYVLVWLQTTQMQNGTYIWNGAVSGDDASA